MSRTADYTIQGFLYQFNKTLIEVLNASEDAVITIEGVIEDIEVTTLAEVTGIQCKYHETVTNFTPSIIYNPLLQMMCSFSSNPSSNIKYVLFVHFKNESLKPPTIDKSICDEALSSTDKKLKKIIDKISPSIDVEAFLNKFSLEYGPGYDELVSQVSCALQNAGFQKDEIETITYPNAIHIVARLAILHNSLQRQITRKELLDRLNNIRITTISRWTLALKSRHKLLETRRKQLKKNLSKNSRTRYFVIDPVCFQDYGAEIVLFISDYLDKYHNGKASHTETPLFCICGTHSDIEDIQYRLYKKGIRAIDGFIGGKFEESRFFDEPMVRKDSGGLVQREFALRITDWEQNSLLLNKKKCDDLFLLAEEEYPSLDTVDVNVEMMSAKTLKEIKYIMNMSDTYE